MVNVNPGSNLGWYVPAKTVPPSASSATGGLALGVAGGAVTSGGVGDGDDVAVAFGVVDATDGVVGVTVMDGTGDPTHPAATNTPTVTNFAIPERPESVISLSISWLEFEGLDDRHRFGKQRIKGGLIGRLDVDKQCPGTLDMRSSIRVVNEIRPIHGHQD